MHRKGIAGICVVLTALSDQEHYYQSDFFPVSSQAVCFLYRFLIRNRRIALTVLVSSFSVMACMESTVSIMQRISNRLQFRTDRKRGISLQGKDIIYKNLYIISHIGAS